MCVYCTKIEPLTNSPFKSVTTSLKGTLPNADLCTISPPSKNSLSSTIDKNYGLKVSFLQGSAGIP